jgi:hypothetical protein
MALQIVKGFFNDCIRVWLVDIVNIRENLYFYSLCPSITDGNLLH